MYNLRRSVGQDQSSTFLENKLYGGKKPAYDANEMQGLPVGVQIVGRSQEDEKVIAMMKVVEGALKTTTDTQ